MKVVAAKTDCGTAMCIAGHALDLQGYKVRFVEAPCGKDCCGYQTEFFAPSGRKVDALKAASREMGLSYGEDTRNDAYGLFHDFSLKTPKQAAARIEALIKEAEPAR